MIRVAAAGDLHFGTDSAGSMREALTDLDADALLLAGDLTKRGRPEEASVLAQELAGLHVPVVAVLGNHDYHGDRQDEVRHILEEAGVRVAEGEAVIVDSAGGSIGVAGVKGFGGGFAGASGSEFGEPEMKVFMRVTMRAAHALGQALSGLRTDVRVVLMHFSPIPETLAGEPREIYPFLGSHLLAEPIDRHGADLVLHGHAHRGVEKGETPGGIPVRNVAQPVLGAAYKVYRLHTGDGARLHEDAAREAASR